MEGIGKLLQALSGLAWPALIFFGIWQFRAQLESLFQLARQQLASGAAFKWRNFEFKGLDLASFDTKDGSGYRQENVDKNTLDQRHNIYTQNKNLFLVHRVRLTGETHAVTRLPTYDVSVYLVSHKNFGHLNDVREVQYYFGQHFGLRHNDYGTKFIVENGTDSFAVRVTAYGPMLCEARIVFHDGSETKVNRYLDFEGTSYRFSIATNAADIEKIKKRQEA